MLFVNYPLKVKVFYWTYFELWIAVTAFYLNITVTLPSQLRWRLKQAIHETTRSLQTFCLLPYCRWNLMPRMPPCHQKWCLDVKSGSHLSKLRIRKSERSEKYFQLIFLGQAKNEINNVTMVLQLLWNHGTIHWEHYWLNKKQLKKGSFLFLALRCLFLPQASPHPLAPQSSKGPLVAPRPVLLSTLHPCGTCIRPCGPLCHYRYVCWVLFLMLFGFEGYFSYINQDTLHWFKTGFASDCTWKEIVAQNFMHLCHWVVFSYIHSIQRMYGCVSSCVHCTFHSIWDRSKTGFMSGREV